MFLIIFQDAVKLLHQVRELLGVFFLNDGLSEVPPCFPGFLGHISCFFQGIRVGNTSSLLRPSVLARMIGRITPKLTEIQAQRFIISDTSRLISNKRPFPKLKADFSSAVCWSLLQ